MEDFVLHYSKQFAILTETTWDLLYANHVVTTSYTTPNHYIVDV